MSGSQKKVALIEKIKNNMKENLLRRKISKSNVNSANFLDNTAALKDLKIKTKNRFLENPIYKPNSK